MVKGITKRSEDYSKWYLDVIATAKLADYAPVKGCMVIRPNGYAIWERMQAELDRMFKEAGHVNAYFPLLIPESFMRKEADHVEGFAPECATVTHGGGKKLDEPLVIRPTSETVIWSMYKDWIQSYRDLPILINQWANVVRWEMRTRLFLRTMEFLWQEGHTAHATPEEGQEETLKILNIYKTFAEDFMAMPVLAGVKTEKERFAGAKETYAIEAMMQDKRALQAGTSHNLGQNFAKAFDVKFQDKEGNLKYVWATSWGVSTRLIGGLIMTHSDDNGLVIPPKLAPLQVVIIPIWKSDDEKSALLNKIDSVTSDWKGKILFKVDDRDNYRPGWKFNEWEKQGIPIRLEMGPRDLAENSMMLVRRDTGEKTPMSCDNITREIPALLETIQKDMFEKARDYRDNSTYEVDDYAELKERLKSEGGFYRIHWNGKRETEDRLQNETKATIRVIEENAPKESGKCILSGEPSERRVVIAKSY